MKIVLKGLVMKITVANFLLWNVNIIMLVLMISVVNLVVKMYLFHDMCTKDYRIIFMDVCTKLITMIILMIIMSVIVMSVSNQLVALGPYNL